MFAIYIVGKLLLYSAWCHVGMRMLAPTRLSAATAGAPGQGVADEMAFLRLARVLGLGFFRLVLGIVVAVVVVLVARLVFGLRGHDMQQAWAYLLVWTPLRALEWWVVSQVIGREVVSWPVAAWVAGGVLVTFLADVPGRFIVVNMLGAMG